MRSIDSPHTEKHVQFHYAPQPLQVRLAAHQEQSLATGKKYGQAKRIGLNFFLVDEALVNPDLRLPAVLPLKLSPPCLPRRPLGLRQVAPRMRAKCIDLAELSGLRASEERCVR